MMERGLVSTSASSFNTLGWISSGPIDFQKESNNNKNIGNTINQNHRITESYRLEKTLKIIESNRKPNTTKTTTIPCL
ncbi:hypothetical protein QYF61_000530 [Mycteria americana]|uniref:Uncharacterized protein n=1 Tax=Mycteria americana TaxID=33587 RepID=A0AAN7S4Y9_MYCAM|nr:hypothetical protein QYF61_000530 [Mycteria americana]